jgi:hypothetical protein
VITVSAQRLFEGVNELLAGKSELPTTNDWYPVRGHLDLALGEAWNSEWWQFLMRGEYRYFRALWLAASTYNKTDEVYDAATQTYFQCLRDSVTGAGFSPTDSNGDERSAYWAECKTTYAGANWASGTVYAVGDIIFYPVDAAFYQCHTAHTSSGTLVPDATGGNERWGVLTPFARYVDYLQTGQTRIGYVMDVKTSNPRISKQWDSLAKQTLEDRVYVLDAVKRVWLDFRLRRPRLTGDFYSSSSGYAIGAQMYFVPSGEVGNFYNCIDTAAAGESPSTDPLKWEVVEIPEGFDGFLIWSAFGKMLTAEERADERRNAFAVAEGYLALLADQIYRQAGETPNIPMRTYP